MGKDAPKAPAPVVVNPSTTATGQAEFNKEAALQQRALNLVDQYTPQGTIKYEATGQEIEGIPQYKVTQAFSPEEQQLYDVTTDIRQQYADIGQKQLGAVGEKLQTPFEMSQFGAAPTFNDAYRSQQLENIMTRMQPGLDKQRASLETSLANQGFVVGTEAYDTAIDEYNRALNDARIAADIQSTGIAGQQYGLEAQARDRAINEALMERTQPMSELAAFLSGSQPSTGQFLPAPQGSMQAPDYMGAAYGSANMANTAAQNQYNQQMAASNASLQGLYGLGAAGLGAAGYYFGGSKASDARVKENIKPVGKLNNGLTVYSYNYIGNKAQEIGLIAQEVEKIKPSAVSEFNGIKAVNYAEAVK